MAYYQTGYRYRRYKKHSGRKKWIILAAVLAAVIGVFVFFHKNVSGMLYSLSEATVRAAATEAVNDAVSQTLRWNNVDYNKLVTVTRGEDDRVLSLEADAQSVNLLARQTVTLSMANLSEACGEGVKVPIGVFTGIEFLAGFGPRVTFQIIPIGSVSCDFRSSFDTAGLNQTLHSIYMDVTAAVSVVMPSKTEEISVVTQVLICESVIVGEIPDAYLKGDIFG
ncbi:MAG TPA: sporulation protein YunB [Candidatus Borkfalkia excrementipullorum]|nr:sporulation protein YunB [Candidatus Borkfalkia excrementipullorum]